MALKMKKSSKILLLVGLTIFGIVVPASAMVGYYLTLNGTVDGNVENPPIYFDDSMGDGDLSFSISSNGTEFTLSNAPFYAGVQVDVTNEIYIHSDLTADQEVTLTLDLLGNDAYFTDVVIEIDGNAVDLGSLSTTFTLYGGMDYDVLMSWTVAEGTPLATPIGFSVSVDIQPPPM